MSYSILATAPRRLVLAPLGYPSDSPGRTADGAVLRCILVNGARLKTEACCTACGEKIGGSYVRQIGAKNIFCDFACYQDFGSRHSLETHALCLPAIPDPGMSWR